MEMEKEEVMENEERIFLLMVQQMERKEEKEMERKDEKKMERKGEKTEKDEEEETEEQPLLCVV